MARRPGSLEDAPGFVCGVAEYKSEGAGGLRARWRAWRSDALGSADARSVLASVSRIGDGKMNEWEREVKEQLKAGNDIAAGLFAIAAELRSVGVHLKYLGNGDAATTMGAIEALGVHLGEKINDAGNAVAGALSEIAMNVERDE